MLLLCRAPARPPTSTHRSQPIQPIRSRWASGAGAASLPTHPPSISEARLKNHPHHPNLAPNHIKTTAHTPPAHLKSPPNPIIKRAQPVHQNPSLPFTSPSHANGMPNSRDNPKIHSQMRAMDGMPNP